MSKILDEENKYLDYVEKVIESELKKSFCDTEKLKNDSIKLSFEDRLRGTHFNLNSQLFNIGEKIDKLEKAKNCPYFGRINFQSLGSNKMLPIYIGKSAITDNNNLVVYDWRSSICSLYYDSEIGPVSYNSSSGIQNGNLLLKRQIIIKDGHLINVIDSNLVTDDELLLPYLNANVDNKMKTIISSIQKEQNFIIRLNNQDIIVQGVAGSGKSSVALHRIAYLIYAMKDQIKSNDFLVIGPNDYFLNYISSVLPELESKPVEQKTLLELMNDYLNTNLSLSEEVLLNSPKQQMQKNISLFKGSFEYCNLLDVFFKRCIDGNEIVTDDFKIDGKVVFSANMIRERLFGDDKKHFYFDRTRKYYKALFKEKKEEIYTELNEEYRSVYINLPMDDPVRKEYVKKSTELKKQVKQQGAKLLDKYFKSINKSCLALYVSFISELDQVETSLNKEEMMMLQKDTLKSIRKKQIPSEDIPALLYLNYRLTNKKMDYKNIVIDEAQDYSIFTYYVLKKIFANAKFNIYGDLAQAIYPYKGIGSWEELNKCVFDNKCTLLELSKSYRTTTEITETANSVLNALGLHYANPVIRHGSEVDYSDINDNPEIKVNKIKEWIDLGYQKIAIICKNELESKEEQSKLLNMGINSQYISGKDEKFTNGVFVLSVASAKGLEFDCTIINNASANIYDINNDVDMHLLYVALTRALHEQIVIYDKNITKPLEDKIKKNKVLKKYK